MSNESGDRIEALLRQAFKEPPLADEGFTARVVARLPRSQPTAPDIVAAVGWVLAALGVGISLAVVLAVMPWNMLTFAAGKSLERALDLITQPAWSAGLAIATLSGVATVFAIRRD